MTESITVRRATIADLETALPPLLQFFAQEGFRTSPEQVRTRLSEQLRSIDSAVFLAWHGGNVIGVATVTTTRGLEFGISAEIEDLYVLPEARGSGAGTVLIDAATEWCRTHGCSVVVVVVTPEAQTLYNLIEYYRDHGFAESGRTIMFRFFAPLAR